uniref:chloride conductance regulatory protein ICln n=1 Tax=Erigeron canadensis TaxID=72917 RepID=UPI001CB8CB00|nr:chloride conductance regulatory protein ICln [Erigeron canadensis]
MATGLRPFSERSADGTPLLDTDNGEELMHVQPNVSIVLASHPPQSPGTLYISTKKVVWLSDTDRAKGYSVDFVSVSLHAVSRDPEAFVSPCIYTQIDNGEEEDESEGSDSESSETLDLSKITEMRLVPSDATQLDTLFAVFCECAELNPEPVEEEEEQHNWIFSADQLGAEIEGDNPAWNDSQLPFTIGYSNGDQDLARSVLELQINDQRFEDADEMVSDDSDEHHP